MKKVNKVISRLYSAIMAGLFLLVGFPLWSVIVLALLAVPGVINFFLDFRDA